MIVRKAGKNYSSAVFFGHLSKVIAHGGKRQSVGKIVWMKSKQIKAVFPEGNSLAVANSECHYYPIKSFDVLDQSGRTRLDPIFMKARQTVKGPAIILFRTIDISKDSLVTLDERVGIHLGHEIHGTVRIVSGTYGKESSFLLKPPPKLCIRKS